MAVHSRVTGPALNGTTVDTRVHEGRMQTGRQLVYAGSRLKLSDMREGPV